MAEQDLMKFIESLPDDAAENVKMTLTDYIQAQRLVLSAAVYLAEDPRAITGFEEWIRKTSGNDKKENVFTRTLRAAKMAVALDDASAFLLHVTKGLERIAAKTKEETTDEASNSRGNG
jgi:hypothetical protein